MEAYKAAFKLEARSGPAWFRFLGEILLLLIVALLVWMSVTPGPQSMSDLRVIQGKVSDAVRTEQNEVLIYLAGQQNPFWISKGRMEFFDGETFFRDIQLGSQLAIAISPGAVDLLNAADKRVPALDIRSGETVYLPWSSVKAGGDSDQRVILIVLAVALALLAVLLFFSFRAHDFQNIRADLADLVSVSKPRVP